MLPFVIYHSLPRNRKKKRTQKEGKEAHSQFLLMDSFVFSAVSVSIERLKAEKQKTYPLIFLSSHFPLTWIVASS